MAYSILPVLPFAVPGTPTPMVCIPEAFTPFSVISSLTSRIRTFARVPAVMLLSVAMLFSAMRLHASSTRPAVMPVPPTSIPISYISFYPICLSMYSSLLSFRLSRHIQQHLNTRFLKLCRGNHKLVILNRNLKRINSPRLQLNICRIQAKAS